MPGAGLENVTDLADKEVSTIGRRDTVTVMAGANDSSKQEANIGRKHLGKFVNSWQNINMMTVTAARGHV